MSLRDDLIPLVDDARQLAVDVGVRVRPVTRVVRTWTGAKPGAGTSSEVSADLTPTPKVRDAVQVQYGPAGAYETGDLLVTRVSAAYGQADLEGTTLEANQELFYLIQGVPYRLLSLTPTPFEYRLILRRLRR